jgi:hypothetical protein
VTLAEPSALRATIRRARRLCSTASDLIDVTISVRAFRLFHRPSWHPNPYRMYGIDPQLVRLYLPSRERFPRRPRLRVVGGNWDRKALPFEEHVARTAIRQRYVEGIPWEETRLRAGQAAHRRQEAFSKADALYGAMVESGWQPVGLGARRIRSWPSIAIGRNGDLIRNTEGAHRLSIAQHLGLREVGVRIAAVHADCQMEAFEALPLRPM